MKALLIVSIGFLVFPFSVWAEIWGYEDKRNAYAGFVWQYALPELSWGDYASGVEALFHSFEEKTGKRLVPAEKGRAGIKVYTNSGSGISTPLPLVKAVIDALKRRGFGAHDLFILDANESRLRESRFIPPLSQRHEGQQFYGVPVYALDTQRYFDPLWFYDSPLPQQSGLAFSPEIIGSYAVASGNSENRKSFLPKPLLTEIDFWINLPMAMDHPAVGVSGALMNATLWNMSNRDRFFVSPANAPVAVAEIAAIPELASGLAVTILAMERYQFIGGPFFNSLYTRSEKVLWMSVNLVVLDALVLQRLNTHREKEGFQSLGKELPMLQFAEMLGLGFSDISRIQWIRLP